MKRALLYPFLRCGAVLVTLISSVLLAACIRPEPLTAPAAVTSSVQGRGNQLQVRQDGAALQLEVYSTSGIGKATLTVTASLPLTVTLRLHLTGLEHLQVNNGATTLVAQVSSQADHAISQAVATAPTSVSAAQAIDATHPLWLTITSPSAAQPYFVVTLPAAFLATVDSTLTIEWIDFYR